MFGFDDSFFHSAYNGGGQDGDFSRVVLDVSFWHPAMHPAALDDYKPNEKAKVEHSHGEL